MTDPLPIPDDEADLGEIVVIGRRPVPGSPKNNPPPEEQVELDPFPEPTPPDGAVWTQEEVDAEAERLEQCAAKAFENSLQTDEPSRMNRFEFSSFTFERNGQILTHPPRGGTGVELDETDFNPAVQEFGITFGEIRGLNHNIHPDIIAVVEER